MTSPWDHLVSLLDGVAEVVVAAPYIKVDPLRRLLERLSHLERLTCVTRWQVGDIASGVSDTAVWDLVHSFGGSFRLHPRLHAKYYRFGDEVLVGSANLTDAGLGLGRLCNLEILTRPWDGFDSVEFERELMVGSREIDEAEFEAWDAIPVVASNVRAGPDTALLGWYPVTRDPSDLFRFYSGDRQSLPLERQQNAQSDLLRLGVPDDLDPIGLKNWVRAGLLSSSFVADVRGITSADEPQAFLQLAHDWGVEPGVARYRAETVRTWLAYFLGAP